MALFKRRRPAAGGAPDPAPVPDGSLTFLSSADADDFRQAAAVAFADIGLTVTMHADHAVDAKGRQFGFWNVAALCASLPRAEWPATIDQHLRTVLAGMDAPSPFEGLDADEAHFRTYARLYEEAGVPAIDNYPRQSFAPGLVEIMALDLPDAVAMFRREHVADLGGFEALRRSGIANLAQLPVEHLEVLDAPGNGKFHALFGDSVYTASRALLLPRLATDLTGEVPTDHGWLMCVPNRHQIAWHVIRDSTVISAVQGMVHFARLGYNDSPGPLSPHVYWWNGAAYEQLTHPSEDGGVRIEVSPRFQAVLEAVAEQG